MREIKREFVKFAELIKLSQEWNFVAHVPNTLIGSFLPLFDQVELGAIGAFLSLFANVLLAELPRI